MKKRILPALLALCMVMSLLPMAVFASSEGGSGTTTEGGQTTGSEGKDETKTDETTTPAAKFCKCGCPIAEEKKAEEDAAAVSEAVAAGCGKCIENDCGCEKAQLTDDACDCNLS